MHEPPSVLTILSAKQGDPESIEALTNHYRPYIKWLACKGGRMDWDLYEQLMNKVVEVLFRFDTTRYL